MGRTTEEGFRGIYNFLSNFYYFEKPLTYQGVKYVSNEHFYQAMKFKTLDLRKEVAEHRSKGLKKFVNSKKDLWREDWDEVKLKVMEYGLRYKFSEHNMTLLSKLIGTEAELVEYNYWNDTFWGVCKKTDLGNNHLGKLLMKIREELWNT